MELTSFNQVVELREASLWPEPSRTPVHSIPAPQFLGEGPPTTSALGERSLHSLGLSHTWYAAVWDEAGG